MNLMDCAGVCNGDAITTTFYSDTDGDGLGDPDTEVILCGVDGLGGYVTNPDDEDDNCASNIHDCADVCDGNFVVDDCSDCVDPGDFNGAQDCAGICDGEAIIQTYWDDSDGDGLGFGIGQDHCSADVPDGWIPNNDDVDDNCFSNIIDECGVCNGNNSSCADCAGTPWGDAVIEDCYPDGFGG